MTALLVAAGLVRQFERRAGLVRRRRTVRAVDGVDLAVARGETLGIVGESGSGKSTLGRLLLGLERPTAGTVRFDGLDLAAAEPETWRRLRRRLQMVFQDTLGALNPRLTIGTQLAEGLEIHGIGTPDERPERIRAALAPVGLGPELLDRYPHALSGGQRQRVGIARALLVEPELIVCDEPVSALDVSVQAQVLNLLADLKAARGLTYLFISHDLRVVRQIADRVAVLYLGGIVELAPTDDLYEGPRHPYARALIDAAPTGDPRRRRPRLVLAGDSPSPLAPPAGCAFHPRCRFALDLCRRQRPLLAPVAPGHIVACHRAGDLAA